MSSDTLAISGDDYDVSLLPSSNGITAATFLVASYLTDPICKVHEFYHRLYVVDVLNPTASSVENLARKFFLCVGMMASTTLAVFTTLPGIALRLLAVNLRSDPFNFEKKTEGKVLPPDETFSLLSWNICCINGGYAITDGGLLPWGFRIDSVINKIIEKDADVNCLYEVFDPQTAKTICERLQERGYSHFYFNIGTKAVGVSSGILVASKYEIKKPEFTPYPQDALVGRTKNAAKGVFGFDLESRGHSFARIFSTHLQHSEEPQFPTDKEEEARRKQMRIVMEKVDMVRDKCLVVTGDLNLDDNEYNASFWQGRFQKGDRFAKETWGGDAFCAQMGGKRISAPSNLDHTMVLNGTARSISTSLVETGYDGKVYKKGPLSDHEGLLSLITV